MKMISSIAVLFAGVFWLGCTQANPADYNGTFKDEEITVALSGQEGRYTGTIQMEENAFPLSVRKVGGALKGTFESKGNRFDVEMNLKGHTLVLVTGGTTYRLQRVTPAVNPLARPAQAAEEKKQAPQPKAAAPTSVLRLKKVSISDRDDMIGGEAFSFLAPADWQVDGGDRLAAQPDDAGCGFASRLQSARAGATGDFSHDGVQLRKQPGARHLLPHRLELFG